MRDFGLRSAGGETVLNQGVGSKRGGVASSLALLYKEETTVLAILWEFSTIIWFGV
jgi:hypothetical protein